MRPQILRRWMNELTSISKELGEPTGPSKNCLNKRWDAVVRHSPPRSIFYITNIKDFTITRKHGFHWLGYDEHIVSSLKDVIHVVPQFQQLIILYQILGVYRILKKIDLELFTPDGYSSFYYSAIRAITDRQGKNWLVAQTGEPWQYDKNGRVVSHLNWFHIIAPYKGEAIRGEFFHKDPEKYAPKIEKLNKQLHLEKQKFLDELDFSVQQKEIIKAISLGQSTQYIADEWGITVHGVRYHYRRIKNVLEELFCQKFSTTEEAVDYLSEQQIFI